MIVRRSLQIIMDSKIIGPISKDETFDVPDSTDWLGTPLAGLVPVEQALRCHVCKDFYTSPMITSCSHTFCSLCIRRCLAVDGKCPLCRHTDQESKLRGNWAMREAVDAFVKSRDAILAVARQPPTWAVPGSPKRKAVNEMPGDEEGHYNKRTRTSTRLSKAKAAETTAAMMREEVDAPESRDPMDYEPGRCNDGGMAVVLLLTCPIDDGLVSCPICWKRMKPQLVDKHIDTTCPGSPQPQSSSSTAPKSSLPTILSFDQSTQAPARAPERLPSLNYSVMKDVALRKKMSELGISTFGPRQLLEKRHKEWVTVWNANCDSARPKKRSELLQDLNVWERTLGSQAPTMSRSANLGAQIKDKDFDGAAWAAKHNDSFKDLIANARRSSKAKPEGPKHGTSTPDGAADSKSTDIERPQISISPLLNAENLAGSSHHVDLTNQPSSPPRAQSLNLMDDAELNETTILGRDVRPVFTSGEPYNRDVEVASHPDTLWRAPP